MRLESFENPTAGRASFESVGVNVQRHREWSYQFLIDGERLINDWNADDYVTTARRLMPVIVEDVTYQPSRLGHQPDSDLAR